MRYVICLFFASLLGCSKPEFTAEELLVMCHEDLSKPLRIKAPLSGSHIKHGKLVEVTWHGSWPVDTYEVSLVQTTSNTEIKLDPTTKLACMYTFIMPEGALGSNWIIRFRGKDASRSYLAESSHFTIVKR